MPYNMLLHDDLRSSMGINLANSVVIFDEAHNVVEAVNHIYSADVSYEDLVLAARCVEDYSSRFRSILTGKNYYYVNILLSVINGFKQCLKSDGKKELHGTADAELGSEHVVKSGQRSSEVAPSHAPRASGTIKLAATTELLCSNDFIFRCGLDNVNLFKVKRHVTETNLDSKVGGFGDHQEKKRLEDLKELQASTVTMKGKNQKAKHDGHVVNKAIPSLPTSTSNSNSSCCNNGSPAILNIDVNTKNASGSCKQALRNVLTLITCLTNAAVDGRVAVCKDTFQPSVGNSTSASPNTDYSSSSSIKFILLNPSIHFQKIVDQSRSVLLLGGTLQPFAFVKSFLFPSVNPNNITLFACGHVVNASNVLALSAISGPLGGKFEFTHDTRMQSTRLAELSSSLQLISKSVPHGMVVFFSSYQYMSNVLSKWRNMGKFDDLTATRAVFVEPRLAGDAEKVWTLYSEKAVVDGGKGAMLFCVMGGKLSEGINFSDRLARCVVVIGMPYPDGRDPILQEKLKFATLVEKDEKAGKRLYEAMCMRTVNQCIGRSIRHINDYAAIVLLDCRYSQPRVTTQLPMWLSSEIQNCSDFKDIETKLKTFFSGRTVA